MNRLLLIGSLAFLLVFGLGGASILVSLGVWQVQRLAWKEALLARIDVGAMRSAVDGDDRKGRVVCHRPRPQTVRVEALRRFERPRKHELFTQVRRRPRQRDFTWNVRPFTCMRIHRSPALHTPSNRLERSSNSACLDRVLRTLPSVSVPGVKQNASRSADPNSALGAGAPSRAGRAPTCPGRPRPRGCPPSSPI